MIAIKPTMYDLPVTRVYFKISHVAHQLNEERSAIRFWEDTFRMPVIRNKKGERMYTQINLESFALIHDLVRVKQYTIPGAKRELELRGLMDNKHFLKQ